MTSIGPAALEKKMFESVNNDDRALLYYNGLGELKNSPIKGYENIIT